MKPNLRRIAATCGVVLIAAPFAAAGGDATPHPLLAVLQSELDLSMQKLVGPDGVKPYFLQYEVTDTHSVNIEATLGALSGDSVDHRRLLDVDVRCGDYACDNTRQIRGSGYFGSSGRSVGAVPLPLNDDPLAARYAVWLSTDEAFKNAVKRLAQVQANLKVKVEEEDPSDDFTREQPSVHIGPWVGYSADVDTLRARARKLSLRFRTHPLVYGSTVSISGAVVNELAVNSEGSKLQFGRSYWRISINASTVADDGMELELHDSFDAAKIDELPEDSVVEAGIDALIDRLVALREAPIVEPYTGPAILLNRASGVFFHEIFGHRIEGHRQKDIEEGQTFAKKIDQQVLPDFLSVTDDPSIPKFGGTDLNGYYEFDDECVPAQPAHLVENGILKNFLMSRSPTRGFTKSNGHGRRQSGRPAVSRQGNLIVESSKTVPFEELRKMLLDLCRQQGKPFGLLFDDISGGFTTTQRYGPQAFKVIPLVVYRVYTDGRPDELVRGVDIVGTPLTSFSRIVCAGDDPAVFNGYCGAESGSVPVSAISPSMLVEQIEVEKKQKAQNRPPILPPPIADEVKNKQSESAQAG